MIDELTETFRGEKNRSIIASIPDHIYFSNIEPTNSVRLRLYHPWLWMWWPTEGAMHRVPSAHVMIGCGLDRWNRCCQLYSTNHHSACKISVHFFFQLVNFCVWSSLLTLHNRNGFNFMTCSLTIVDAIYSNVIHLIVHIQIYPQNVFNFFLVFFFSLVSIVLWN